MQIQPGNFNSLKLPFTTFLPFTRITNHSLSTLPLRPTLFLNPFASKRCGLLIPIPTTLSILLGIKAHHSSLALRTQNQLSKHGITLFLATSNPKSKASNTPLIPFNPLRCTQLSKTWKMLPLTIWMNCISVRSYSGRRRPNLNGFKRETLILTSFILLLSFIENKIALFAFLTMITIGFMIATLLALSLLPIFLTSLLLIFLYAHRICRTSSSHTSLIPKTNSC